MRLRYVPPLALAAAAATIGLAPVAAAAPTGPIDQCTATGNSNSVCQRPGHVNIVSSPPVVSRPQYPSLPYPLGPVLFVERPTPAASDRPPGRLGKGEVRCH